LLLLLLFGVDVEMANNLSPEGLVPVADSLPLEDDRKRICTDRSNSSLESVGSETLSPPTSNEDDDDENENDSVYCASISEIIDFKPTQLEVIEEGEFVWRLDDFLALGSSSEFVIGGTPWSLSYSLSDRGPGNKFIGLHLKAENCDQNDPNWAVCAEFILGICNPDVSPTSTTPASVTATLSNTSLSSILSSRLSSSSAGSSVLGKEPPAPLKHAFSQSSFHRFTADELDWGFHHMCPFSAYKNGIPEINVGPLASTDGKTAIVARVRVVKDSTGVLWHNFNNYDSKAVTGYVGLLNQGATCYMNSFVQSIFLTNHFRAAVYKIPTEDVSPTASIPLALQRIFYKLQTGSTPPSTIEMTKSFGWDSAESFMQHDVQEFSRVLMDDLENKMKGSEVEGTVERLFRGKLKNVLKCTQVDYESVREESFYDLQMTIKGVKDLKESFEKYVAAEMLCGDNQYRTDDFGLQDAKKFVTFEHFPPVLHVHLERYAFDMMAEATVKIHDRFEFPVEIELDPYLSENSPDRSESQNYWLHSVLVHAGDGHGGHYFVYIRHPSRPDCWYKFDDTRVIPCTQKEAVDENFGGSDSLSSEETLELFRSTGVKPYRYKKFTSAYLLVYIRKSELDSMLESVDDSSVPEYLVNRIKADDLQDARRRHERQQQHLYSDVTLLTDESIRTHSGPDLCDPEESENVYKCKRETLISDLCSDFLPNEHNTECYPLVPRRNKTVRPDFILSDTHLRTLSTAFPRNHIHPLAFYIRAVSEDMNEPNLWIRPLTPGNILVFFKWFDGEKLVGLGSMAIDNEATLSSVTPFIAQRLEQLDIPCNDAEFSLYEVSSHINHLYPF
jgi:ubiquitin carboxyl-terminal hydrolase 7